MQFAKDTKKETNLPKQESINETEETCNDETEDKDACIHTDISNLKHTTDNSNS